MSENKYQPRLRLYRLRTDPSGAWYYVILGIRSSGEVEKDIPLIKEALRGRYGDSATKEFTAIEYLGLIEATA